MFQISKRKIGICILLSIITCGIYGIYWMYLLVKNTRSIQNNTDSCAGEMLCLIFVPFYALYWWYTRGEKVRQGFAEHDYNATGGGVVYLVLAILGLSIVSMAIMQSDFNSLKSETHSEQRSTIIIPTAVLTVICLFVTLALSSTNMLTAGKIEALAEKSQNSAMSELIEADKFETKTVASENGETEYNEAVKDGKTVGMIFVTQENGYGGTVSIMTAVDTDGKVIAVKILDASNETPGLGQNVTKESFYGQFSDLTGEIVAKKSGTAVAENNEIDAVTGATISSKAVTRAVNTALENAAKIIIAEGD